MIASRPELVRLCAGIVSYRDGPRLIAAVRSLLDQRLPNDAQWTALWLVVSPGHDDTVDLARDLARSDARIHLIIEPHRRGKSAAVSEVMAHASGDFLVLMNGDAIASPAAVGALLAARPRDPGPFAIMARPTPAPLSGGLLSRSIALLWDLHHRFHLEIMGRRGGSHLSDELMLLPIAHLPPMRAGVVNDGAYIAQQTIARGGSLHYASAARVQVSTPSDWREYWRQRRRIARGHQQIRELTGNSPATLVRFARAHPRRATQLVLAAVRRRPGGWTALGALAISELLAASLAGFDSFRGLEAPTAWKRSRPAPWSVPGLSGTEEPAN